MTDPQKPFRELIEAVNKYLDELPPYDGIPSHDELDKALEAAEAALAEKREDYAVGRHFVEQWNTPLPPSKEQLLSKDTLCPVCGIGYIMLSGHCDHCDSKPTTEPKT